MIIKDQKKEIALVLEVDRSIKLIIKGLAEIQKIDSINEFYEPIFIYLSSGFERLFKTILCMNHIYIKKEYPKTNELWTNKNGHDIEQLKQKVENICDLQNEKKNEVLINKILKILSKYGQHARYFDLDVILGRVQDFDCKKEFEEIENIVLKDHLGEKAFYESLSDNNYLDKMYSRSNTLIISKIELLLRDISKQFMNGSFSDQSKNHVCAIMHFLKLDDNQIGKTIY